MSEKLALWTSSSRAVAVHEALELPREKDIKVDPLDLDQYERLKDGFTKNRDLLVCKSLRGTGFRIAELMRITPDHIVREGPLTALLVKRGKTFPPVWERQYVHPQLALELDEYIRGNARPRGQVIFNITVRTIERAFAEAGQRSLGRPVHPHEMRHLYIKSLIEAGLPVEAVAKMVGHKDYRTTFKVYYDLTAAQRAQISMSMRY